MKASRLESFFTLGNPSLTGEDLHDLGRHWAWMLTAGIIYILLGILAFSLPVASTVGVTIGLAALLLVGGFVNLVHAVQLRHRNGSMARFLQAIVSIITGGLMFRYPEAGLLGLAIALSFYFFMSAGTQWVLSSSVPNQKGWNWGLTNALVSFFLGVFILFTFPVSALWLPGTLLGIDMIFGGVAMASLAVHCHRADGLSHQRMQSSRA